MEKAKSLHLMEQECTGVVGDSTSVEESLNIYSCMLITTFLTSRPFNIYALKAMMKVVRRVKKGYVFREIQNNLFLIQFADENDKIRVMKGVLGHLVGYFWH